VPDINNSLALGINANTPDVGKTLLTIGQLNELRTKSALEEATTSQTQQNVDYNQFQQDQFGGLRVNEYNTLQEANQKRSDLRGRFANRLYNDPTDVQGTIKEAADSGVPLTDGEEKKLRGMTTQERQQWAMNHRNASMPSSANMQATGETTANQGRFNPQPVLPNQTFTNQTDAANGPKGFVTNNPNQSPARQSTQAQVDNAIKTGRNFDGSPRVTSTADIVGPSDTFNNRYPSSGADMFTPSIVRGPDGSISSSVTPATTALQGQAIEQYKKAGENAASAQNLGMRLDMMEHSADVLNTTGWSATGAGANAKLGAAKSVNSLLATVGLPPAIDPTKIANWEDLNKETTRAGFDLARTLGSREAATIVQSSVGAVPSAENTPMGFKLVTSGIRQAIQREKDFYSFATDYAKTHRGNTFGADVEFNKQFPADLYAKTAIANAIPPDAIKLMKDDPKLASKFDEKYGSGMAGFISQHDKGR
jgi:hypothetical protein